MKKGTLMQYNNLKLSQKLVYILLLVSVIPILTVQIFNTISTRKNMREQIEEVIYDNLVQISERTNLSLQSYTNLLYQIYVDDTIIQDTVAILRKPDFQKEVAKAEIRERFRQYTSVLEGVRCISLVCANGEQVVYDFATDSSLDHLWSRFPDMRIIPPFRDAEGEAGMVITPSMKFLEVGEEKFYFHISKRLFDFNDLEKGTIGTVIMTIDERVLDAICNSSEKEGQNGINFIVSEEGKLVSYPVTAYVAMDIGLNTQTGLSPEEPELEVTEQRRREQVTTLIRESGYLTDSRIMLNQYKDPATGWYFCNAYDEDSLFENINKAQFIMILMSITVLMFVAVISFYATKRLNRSVSTIIRGMQRVQEGNLGERIEVGGGDEFHLISEHFNEMTNRVKHLIEEVSDAKDRQRDAEITALEAQINPHFIYNTLDSLNWMAIEKGENDIGKAIRSLGQLLRYTVSESNAESTVEQTAHFIEMYFELQEIRYEETFRYSIQAEEQVKKLPLHKLIVQPFTENALIHGLEGMEEGGVINVKFTLTENKEYLSISVIDNGKGIPAELAEMINNGEILKQKQKRGHGLGLSNALNRLKMYYGKKAHWNVNSIEGMGTDITLYIPIRHEDEDSDSRG